MQLVPSKKELSIVHKICKPEKIEVIPLGFNLSKFYLNKVSKRDRFRKKWNIKDNEVAIGIIGRLVPVKNHLFFLKVINKVISSSSIPIRLFIIGDGEEKEKIINNIKKFKIDYSTD